MGTQMIQITLMFFAVLQVFFYLGYLSVVVCAICAPPFTKYLNNLKPLHRGISIILAG